MNFQEYRVWHELFMPADTIPDRFQTATPATIPLEPVREVVLRYCENFYNATEQGLAPVLFGGPGKWKTYAGCAILRYVRWQQIPYQFVECGPWFMTADSLFYASEGRQMLAEIVKVPFLMLDDITQVAPKTRPAELMANVLAERWKAALPTLITGNFEASTSQEYKAFADKYRTDFARRLWHGSVGYRVMVT